MIRHLLNRLLGSIAGRKHHSNHHGHGPYGKQHYSSSDYKKGNYYPPQNPKYGHGHYKKRRSSFSS